MAILEREISAAGLRRARPVRLAFVLLCATAIVLSGEAQTRSRGRDLGIPFPGQTGPLNAITDVAGTAVGHVTLIEGEGRLRRQSRYRH